MVVILIQKYTISTSMVQMKTGDYNVTTSNEKRGWSVHIFLLAIKILKISSAPVLVLLFLIDRKSM